MRGVLASEHGGALYCQRQAIIEPSSPTPSSTAASTASDDEAEPRCAPEWRLITATHNLLKFHRHALSIA
jgi:hypothetical protein